MSTLVARITSLTVGAKIAAIMALLMLPIGHLTYLIAVAVRKDVAFSALERDGAIVIKDLWAGLADATRPDAAVSDIGLAAVKRAQEASAQFAAANAVEDFRRALANPKERERARRCGRI